MPEKLFSGSYQVIVKQGCKPQSAFQNNAVGAGGNKNVIVRTTDFKMIKMIYMIYICRHHKKSIKSQKSAVQTSER
jgi:hypothetical protein